ncbi:hypothetical protein D3C86_1952580 [compost metagenome]
MMIVTPILIIVVKENMLYLKARRSSSGLEETSCRQVNKPSDRTPATRETMTSALDHPALAARLKPYSNVPKPMVERMTLVKSILGYERSATFFK